MVMSSDDDMDVENNSKQSLNKVSFKITSMVLISYYKTNFLFQSDILETNDDSKANSNQSSNEVSLEIM